MLRVVGIAYERHRDAAGGELDDRTAHAALMHDRCEPRVGGEHEHDLQRLVADLRMRLSRISVREDRAELEHSLDARDQVVGHPVEVEARLPTPVAARGGVVE